MADKLQFDLVSPERALASLEVDMVEAPGAEGIFGVLPGHAPFMAVLAPGCLLYTSPSPRDRTRSRMPSSA